MMNVKHARCVFSGHLKMILFFVLLSCGTAVAEELRFAPILNRGAVLQCEMKVAVWGMAEPGATVEVSLDGKPVASERAAATGRWQVELPAQAPGGPHLLEARSGTTAVKLEDVWFGEVWLASGQSNMVMPLRGTVGGEERLATAFPDIRFVRVPQKTGLPVEREYDEKELAWKTFAPPANTELAAVAFYFAEKVQRATGRKIGIIQSSYGGTHAHVWTPLWALEEKPELRHYAAARRKGLASGKTKEQWLKEVADFDAFLKASAAWKKTKEGPQPAPVPSPGPENPYSRLFASTLYENMIAPLVPYSLRGVIWYQGEANTGGPAEYRTLFPALIGAWRKAWNKPELPFLFVQLAAFGDVGDWAGFRAAQTYARDSVPHTGMAVALDCGEKDNIHPRFKQPVGERLARLALKQVYGQPVAARGPLFAEAEQADGAVRVRFAHVEKGLQTADGKDDVPGFEVAGADGVFHPAAARKVGPERVELRCPAVAHPTEIRYGWASWVEPQVMLQNSAGLPAEPFRVPLGDSRRIENK
jgi:sialate O-acetylesterase